MSAIQAALAAATDIEPSKRGNETITDQAYLKRLALGVQDLPDADWNKLSQDAQDWFNAAADAIEKKTDIPAFPDLVKAEPSARRRGSSAAEVKPMASTDAKKGMKVTVVTKRGKEYTGEVVEADDQGLVLEVDGKDVELDHDKIDKISVAGAAPPAEEPEVSEPEVGDTVEVVTKRGKKIMGNITELTDEDMVLKDAAGEVHELAKDRLESVVVKVKNAKAGGGRGGAKAESASSTPKADAEPAGRASAKANGGVSVTTRIRELIAENLDAKKEDVSAALKKEGLEFKQATLDLTFGDMHKIVGILRDRKLLK